MGLSALFWYTRFDSPEPFHWHKITNVVRTGFWINLNFIGNVEIIKKNKMSLMVANRYSYD